MKLIFNKIAVTGYILEFSLENSLDDIYTTINITLPYKIVKKYSLSEGQDVVFTHKNYEIKGKALKFTDNSNDIVKFMIVSHSWYLTVNEDTFQFNSKVATNALKDVFERYEGIKFETSEKAFSSVKIKKIYYEKSLEAIARDLMDQVMNSSGERYYLVNDKGIMKAVKKLGNIAINISNMSDLKRERDISKIKNKIRVVTASEKKITKPIDVENSKSIGMYGTIQKVINIKYKNNAVAKAEGKKLLDILSRPDKTVSFSLPGNFDIKIGYVTNLKGTDYIIKRVKHEVKDGIFLSALEFEVFYG